MQADLLENKAAEPATVPAGVMPEREWLVAKIASLLSEADELDREIRQHRQLLRVARAETELAETPDLSDLERIEAMEAELNAAGRRRETIADCVEAARARLAKIADAETRARKRAALVAIAELARQRAALADELSDHFAKVEAITSQLRQIERDIGEQGRVAGMIVAGSLKDGRRLRRGIVGELTKIAPTFSATVELSRMHRAAGLSEYLAVIHAESIKSMIAEHDADNAPTEKAA